MARQHERLVTLAAAAAWILATAPGVAAQQESTPYSGFLLSGYGTASFHAVTENEVFSNDFNVALNPIILYSLGQDFLFETELEIALEDGQTDVGLEYAQIDFLGFEKVQFVVGKFLLPFGVFGERLHPTWINKLPSMPLLYGHAHRGVAEGALLPILSDVGAMLRLCQPVAGPWSFDLSLYVTQGPEMVLLDEAEGEEHSHAVVPRIGSSIPADSNHDGEGTASAFDIPSVAFGSNFSDNNDNKMLGARMGVVGGGNFELYVSAFHAMYNDEDFLDIYGGNLSAEWRRGPFELRGEGALVWQEFEQEAGTFPTLRSPAYYLQASRRIGELEPVVRWSHLLDAKVSGEVARDELRQMAFGINYWLRPSVPLKAAFELNLDGDERLLLQWAYGF